MRTSQELGDVRSVAVTQANLCQLLLQQGDSHRALSLGWEAYSSLRQHHYASDAQVMQRLLMEIKGQMPGPERFDLLWKELFSDPQPEWLQNVQVSTSSEPARIAPEQLDVIVANTVTVMTTVPEKRTEWRETIEQAGKQAQGMEQQHKAQFFEAILALLDGKVSSLPEDHPYTDALAAIEAGIAAGRVQDEGTTVGVSDELMQAVREFVNAEDWEATRQVVEAQQAVLFLSEVEALFEANISQARAAGKQRLVEVLEQHLALLRDCKTSGIEVAFAKLAAAQRDALPFDAELIPRSIAALLGGPEQKMAHAQYLIDQTNKTTDEGLKALLQVLQLALFSRDLSQLGRDLSGVYRQAWETIAASVEAGGADPRIFELIASTTVAVLGPASNQRSEWRNNLVQLRNQATARGDRNLGALLEAVIGLLDAGGNPAGLGDGLRGMYAKIWQAIVARIADQH